MSINVLLIVENIKILIKPSLCHSYVFNEKSLYFEYFFEETPLILNACNQPCWFCFLYPSLSRIIMTVKIACTSIFQIGFYFVTISLNLWEFSTIALLNKTAGYGILKLQSSKFLLFN